VRSVAEIVARIDGIEAYELNKVGSGFPSELDSQKHEKEIYIVMRSLEHHSMKVS